MTLESAQESQREGQFFVSWNWFRLVPPPPPAAATAASKVKTFCPTRICVLHMHYSAVCVRACIGVLPCAETLGL